MVNQQKKLQVNKLNNLLKEKSNFLLVKVDKATHKSLENLRKQLRKNNSSLKVIKNTLFEKAVNLFVNNQLFFDLKKKFFPLKYSSALITFDKNWDQALKTIFQFIEKEKTLAFKFGLLEKSLYSNEELERIAKLPSRSQLMGKIIASLKSPTNKLVYSLKFNMNKIVYLLKEKSKS